MTKEEFVRNGSWILKVISDRCEMTQAETDYLNCLIEVLEQEPCDDCISRSDLREALFVVPRNEFQQGWNDALKSVYENAPSVQPKPRKGEWKPMLDRWGDIVTTVCGYECSICGEWNADNDKFCPNCGADMRKENE